MQYDKRALKILFDTYWSSAGWKKSRHTPPDDLAFAMRAGIMFPPCTLNHDAVVERALSLRKGIAPIQVGSAFIAALAMKQPAILSALGSLAVALNMPAHRTRLNPGEVYCSVCGSYENNEPYDVNVLNFERHKWGGVRHTDTSYIAFDLERFEAEFPNLPTEGDREILDSLFTTVENMPTGAKLGELVRNLKPVLPGNDAQRRTVIELLCLAGVLRIPGRIGFLRSFPIMRDREHTPWSKDDWGYPARWWRGGEGIDREAVSFWFAP